MTITVIGSSLAALVAVNRIAESKNVTWVQTSSRIGGHFSGVMIGDGVRDAGMVLLEPFEDFDGNLPELADLKRGSRHDVRELIPFAFDWLKSYGIDFTQANVFTSYKAELIDDFYIKDSLDLVRALPSALKMKIAHEIASLKKIENSTLHPREKLKNPEFSKKTFEEMVLLTIGPTYLQEVINPWANSFARDRAVGVAAIEHRSVWLPLYFPESILRAVTDETDEFEKKEKKFVAPTGMSVGKALEQLAKQATNNSKVCLVSANDYDYKIDKNLIIFLGTMNDSTNMNLSTQVFLNSKENQTDIAIALFDGKVTPSLKLKDCTINVHDSPNSLYRFSIREIRNPNSQVEFAFEFGNSAGLDDSEIERICIEVISPFYQGSISLKKVIRTKFEIIDGDTLAANRKQVSALDSELADLGIMGFTVGPFNSAFNDQICQGLICAEISRKGFSDAK